MTGFGLVPDPSTRFATSSLVNGQVYAADFASPTPAHMTTAISDMQAAYADAAARTNPAATELGGGNIDGMTLTPGLYRWSSGVTIPTGVTLSGGPNDVWIMQIAGTLNVGNGAVVTLTGGARPENVFWQTAGQVTLSGASDFSGDILSATAIVMQGGAHLHGRALAQTAVTLIANTITMPSPPVTPINAWACSSGDMAPGCASVTLSPLPAARSGVAVMTMPSDGKLYAVDGQTGSGIYSSTAEAYRHDTNTWVGLRRGAGRGYGHHSSFSHPRPSRRAPPGLSRRPSTHPHISTRHAWAEHTILVV